MTTSSVDVVVVGGGPAGLATAIRARLEGLRVIVLDRSRPPLDRACGEGLMPDGLERLSALGVEPDADGRARFRGIRYLDGEIVVEGEFPGVVGWGIRRTSLHRALLQRAQALDVEVCWGRKATGLSPSGVETDAGTVVGRWVVGADGRRSDVRRWAGLSSPAPRRRRFGVRRHFTLEPWTDLVEVYWAHGCEAYVTPVGPRRVGVALLWSEGKSSFDTLLGRFPELERRLAGAPAESRALGAGPLEQQVKGVWSGRVALVGDAAGFLDPIAGEGLALAFHQAFALVEALTAEDLVRYGAAHRQICRAPLVLTRLLLLIEEHPRLRRRVMRALAAEPDLFARLLAVHVRKLAPRDLGVGEVLRFARRLVAA